MVLVAPEPGKDPFSWHVRLLPRVLHQAPAHILGEETLHDGRRSLGLCLHFLLSASDHEVVTEENECRKGKDSDDCEREIQRILGHEARLEGGTGVHYHVIVTMDGSVVVVKLRSVVARELGELMDYIDTVVLVIVELLTGMERIDEI